MKTTLFYAITGGAVNRELGTIGGVSVLTQGEAKGHGVFIDQRTLETFKACADAFPGGVRVKANHGTGFEALVGSLDKFRIDGQKLIADLRLLKSDSQYQKTMDLAETMPSIFGLSPSFSLTTEKINGVDYARCEDLYSVDLVDQPAANPSGLFDVDSKKKEMSEFKEFVSGLFGKDGTVTELQAANAELKHNFSAAQAEVTNLKAKNSELTAEISRIKGERDAFEVTIKNSETEIEKRAGLKANEILAKFGQPPLQTKPAEPGASDIFAQWEAIKDPVKKQLFYRKNKEAFDLGYREWAATQPHSIAGLKFNS